MRCHFISIKSVCDGTLNESTGKPFVPEDFDGPIWIPGCMGGAVGGKDGCYCYKPISKGKKSREQTIENLERECSGLRAINDNLNKKNRALQKENAELLRAGLPLQLRRKIEGDKAQLWIFLKRLIDK